MLTSLTKNLTGRKQSSSVTSSAQQRHDATLDSSNNGTASAARPVHVIEEDKTVDFENHQIDHQNQVMPIAFDETSLSTHGSLYQVPVQTVIICDQEGKVVFGNDAFGNDEDDPTMDKKESSFQKTKEQTEKFRRADDNIELSFHVDGSMLDASVMDRVLENFRFTSPNPRPSNTNSSSKNLNDSLGRDQDSDDDDDMPYFPKTKGSPALVNENESDAHQYDENLENSAFAEIGKLMFKQQPDTHQNSSKSGTYSVDLSSTVHHSDAVDPGTNVTEDKNLQTPRRNKAGQTVVNLIMIFKSITAFFTVYGARAFWLNLTKSKLDMIEIETSAGPYFTEESFHYAMYHLSTLTDRMSVDDLPSDQEGRFSSFMTAAATVLTYHLIGYIMNKVWFHPKIQKEVPQEVRYSSKATPKSEPKLIRELNSLDRKKVFASTFVTEVLSPDGSISSVKRSSRVKKYRSDVEESGGNTHEVTSIKMDLFPAFKAEPKWKNDEMKLKVKTEKV